MRKIAGITEALSKVKVGKDAVSRIARRLEEQQREWRERSLEEKEYPYLYLDATYLKVRWGASVTSMALLACVGVDEEGFREVLAEEFVELYGGRLPKAVGVFEAGISDTLTYLTYPGSHHARIRTTNPCWSGSFGRSRGGRG